jgi:hypothetical protein
VHLTRRVIVLLVPSQSVSATGRWRRSQCRLGPIGGLPRNLREFTLLKAIGGPGAARYWCLLEQALYAGCRGEPDVLARHWCASTSWHEPASSVTWCPERL